MASAFCLRTEGASRNHRAWALPPSLLRGRSSPQAASRAPRAHAPLQVPSPGYAAGRATQGLSTQDHFLCNKQGTDRIEKTGEPQEHPRTAGILWGWKGQCATVYVSLHLHRVGSSLSRCSGLPARSLRCSWTYLQSPWRWKEREQAGSAGHYYTQRASHLELLLQGRPVRVTSSALHSYRHAKTTLHTQSTRGL